MVKRRMKEISGGKGKVREGETGNMNYWDR